MDPFSGRRRRAPARGPGGPAGIGARRRNHPRAFIGTFLIVLSATAAFFTPAAPVLAAGNSCVTSGPGSYTVSACITVPADGATVSGTQTVTGTISVPTGTNPGITRAVFFLRGAYVLTDYTSPYTFALKTTDFVDGTALLELEADMKDGFASAHASITLTLNNGVLTPPVNTNTFTPRTPAPAAGQPLIVAAAGDGAGGEPNETAATNLISGMNPDMLLYLGDVYEKGSLTEFENWYGNSSSWYGQFRPKTNPIVGNHEYEGNAAPGYFNYWDNIPHYYSYNDAGWHFIALDSTSQFNQTAPGSAQYAWLANDLATNTQPCTIAYFHHPRYSVGPQGDSPQLDQIWSLFNAWSVDIVLNGHDHDYQRWLPLDASGNPSPTGVTEFVVGTGGHGIQGFNRIDSRVAKGLDTSPAGIGALKLALGSGNATYQFVSATQGLQDSGSISCTPSTSDTTPPTSPANLTATPLGANRVDLNWSPATDNVGVVSYDLSRNSQFLSSIPGSSTSYTDTSVQPSTAYTYTVSARDLAGNSSPPSLPASATTTSGTSVPVLTDDFESGGLATWTNIGMVVQGTEVYAGSFAARATTTSAATWAWHSMANQTNAYFRIRFKVLSQGANNLYLMKVRTSTGTSIGGLYLGDSGNTLNYRNDAGAVTVRSPRTAAAGVWHELQVHYVINGTASQIETWLDGSKVPELSKTDNFGTTPVGRIQIADNSGARAYDLAIDDVVVDTQFISSAPPADTSAPSVPGNVTATAASFDRINVAWSPSIDNVGVVEYDLYRNAEPLDVVLGSSTSYADSTVDPGTTYSYTILAKDAAGNQSSKSSPAVATTPAIAPGAPTGLTASGSDGLVSLSWTPPTSTGGAAITSYRIYRGTTGGGSKTLQTSVATTSFDDSSVTNGTTYYYTVTAVNTAGEGSASGEASATPAAVVTVPGAPRNLVAAPGNGQVGLSWTAPTSNGGSAITGYSVYRATTSGAETQLIALGNVTSYVDSSTTNGTAYFYQVTATNGTGEGAASAESSATPASAPGAPTGLGAIASPSQVSLSWTAPSSDGGSAITGYQIWRSTTSGSESLLTTIGVATSYTDTGRTNGTTYYYQVAAVNAVAAGGLSNEASATPITVPGTPIGLGATLGNGQVDLAWTAPSSNGGSAITGYDVYRSTSSGTEVLVQSLISTTSFTDTGLTNGTTYFYMVSAVNGAGEGGLSGEASATPATNPGAPGGLTATAGSGSVGLGWSAAVANGSAVTNYKVYRGTTSGGEALLTTLGNVTTYTDGAVTPGVAYYYTLSAVNGVGEGAQSTEANATPTAPPPLLTEGFESGSLTTSGWTVAGPIAASTLLPHAGLSEARDQCAGSACWAWRPFSAGQSASDFYAQAWINVGSADKSSTNLFKFRTGGSGSGAAVFGIVLNNKGKIGYRNDVAAKTVAGTHLLPTGGWHRITVHLVLGTTGHVDVWLDGALLSELSRTDNFGTAAIGKMQLGENGTGSTFDVRYDDLNVSLSALAP